MEHHRRAEDLPVGIEIKGLGLQHIGHAAYGIRVKQDATQDCFFCLNVLRWYGVGQGLEIGLIPLA